jgi:outer membrane protein TolC
MFCPRKRRSSRRTATFKQSEHQYQAGTKASIDRNKSFVEYHTEQQRLISLRGDLLKQTMQLARLIGLPVGQALTLSEDLPGQVPEAVSLEEALKLAFEERSDLKAARLQLKAASEAHRASKAEYLPSLGVKGDYGLEGINPNKGVSVFQAAATVTIPIFQSGRVKADVEQADAALSQRQAEYADEKGMVELDVRQAYVDLQVATEQMAVAIENRKVAAEILTQSLDRFAAGVTNSVEVVQSQETVASAERDYVSTLFSLNLARISLGQSDGTSRTVHSQHAERKLTMPTVTDEEEKDQKPQERSQNSEKAKPAESSGARNRINRQTERGKGTIRPRRAIPAEKDPDKKKEEQKPVDPATKRRRIIIGIGCRGRCARGWDRLVALLPHLRIDG